MSCDYIISGPKEKFKIWYDSLGEYLYTTLQKRSPSEILAINPVSKTSLTCGEALERSKNLSKSLKAMSVQKGDTVAIVCENILDYYIPVLATWYLGAAVYLINFMYTPKELKHAFDICQPKCIFSSLSALPNLLKLKDNNEVDSIIITIDGVCNNAIKIVHMESLIKGEPKYKNFEIEKVDPQDIVVLCLSSGTTGFPKCIQLTNQNTIPTINGLADNRFLNITQNDTVVSFLPFFHIYGFFIHISPIYSSMTLVLLKAFKPDIYLQSIQNYNGTKLFVVPPILNFLIKSPIVNKYNISSVKDVVIGAAPLGKDLYNDAVNKYPSMMFRQLYGCTETGGLCTVQGFACKYDTVGSLISNVQCKVVDLSTNLPVGALQIGELCVKSISNMKGYINNEIATIEAFDSDGFYRTGDIGYYDENQNFFIIDRLKELIKYKGFQVAPAELEDLILSHTEVKDCGVIGIPDEKAGELPLAFVVRKQGSKVTDEEIAQFVSDNISIHKRLHGGVRFVEEIPRTSSGKILRRELRNLKY